MATVAKATSLVAEDRLAGEDRDDLRDHPEGRQDHDVDLGMAEEPEQVLPQQRVAAAPASKKSRAELAVEQQHEPRRSAADGTSR